MFLFNILSKKMNLPSREEALAGRLNPINTAETHFVNGNPIKPPFPEYLERAMFGMGCFWGVERIFWNLGGVWVTAVGYAGGYTPNPTYQEVCTGMTGHNEVVLVVYDPAKFSYESLLKTFWESHDPTQGMRQGNDVGTQYRSGIYAFHTHTHTHTRLHKFLPFIHKAVFFLSFSLFVTYHSLRANMQSLERVINGFFSHKVKLLHHKLIHIRKKK